MIEKCHMFVAAQFREA